MKKFYNEAVEWIKDQEVYSEMALSPKDIGRDLPTKKTLSDVEVEKIVKHLVDSMEEKIDKKIATSNFLKTVKSKDKTIDVHVLAKYNILNAFIAQDKKLNQKILALVQDEIKKRYKNDWKVDFSTYDSSRNKVLIYSINDSDTSVEAETDVTLTPIEE